jgi:hypothetical protein
MLTGVADEKPKPKPSSQWERQQKAREQKLQDIAEAVEDGSLVIRKMTPAERKENPPKPRDEKGRGRGRRN